jgi:predicted amidohydrolase YtcJ
MKASIRPGYAVAALCLALSCQGAVAAAAMADMVLYDGKILTVDKAFSVKSAIAVKDGKILATGGPEIAERYRAPLRIDLKGRTLMPGFMDTHWHLNGASPRHIDLHKVTSIGELQDLVRAKARQLGPGEWVEGYGWDEAKLKEQRNPVRTDLDEAAPDNPVVLARAGMHSAVGNSKALAAAGVTRDSPDPEGGLIEHTVDGEPNGIIRERIQLYYRLIPPPDPAQMRPTYLADLKTLLPLGITSYIMASGSIADQVKSTGNDAGFGLTFKVLKSIYDEHGPGLPRGAICIAYPGAEALRSYPHHTGYGDDWLRIGPIGEQAVDGGFTGPTAWTIDDYKGQPGFRGRAFYTEGQLQELVDTSAELGWQLGLHAIGDAAIRMTVKVYDRALEKYPRKDRRWYLAHFTVMPPDETMKLMAQDKILIAQQPNFTYTLEGRYAATLESEKLAHNNALITPVKKFGLFMAFGSDNLPTDPRVGLYAAVTRKGSSGAVYGPEEALSIQEAIRMYTANGPYLTWDEHKKGTLEAGKFADMIVLDQDPLTIPAEQMLHLNVDLTIVGGKIVYDRAAAGT